MIHDRMTRSRNDERNDEYEHQKDENDVSSLEENEGNITIVNAMEQSNAENGNTSIDDEKSHEHETGNGRKRKTKTKRVLMSVNQ